MLLRSSTSNWVDATDSELRPVVISEAMLRQSGLILHGATDLLMHCLTVAASQNAGQQSLHVYQIKLPEFPEESKEPCLQSGAECLQ